MHLLFKYFTMNCNYCMYLNMGTLLQAQRHNVCEHFLIYSHYEPDNLFLMGGSFLATSVCAHEVVPKRFHNIQNENNINYWVSKKMPFQSQISGEFHYGLFRIGLYFCLKLISDFVFFLTNARLIMHFNSHR